MNLIDQAIKDVQDIMAGDGSVNILIISPTGIKIPITGIHTKHHLGIDANTGNAVNSKKASIAFSENSLPTNFSIRKNGEVVLTSYQVKVADSTGLTKHYRAEQWFPDETLGLIVVILSVYAD